MNLIDRIGRKLERFCDWQVKKVMDKAEKLNLFPDNRSYVIGKYNVEVVFFSLYKLLLIMILSFILGIQNYFFVLFFACMLIAAFAHELHFDNDLFCLLSMLFNYFGGMYLSIYLGRMISTYRSSFLLTAAIASFVFVLCFVLFIFYSPAQTKKRPIKPKEKKRKKKYSLISLSMIYLISLLMLFLEKNQYAVLFMWAMVYQTICILPITFRVLKQE